MYVNPNTELFFAPFFFVKFTIKSVLSVRVDPATILQAFLSSLLLLKSYELAML